MRVWVVLLYAGVLGAANNEAGKDLILRRTGGVHAPRPLNGNGSPARRLLQQQPVQQTGDSGTLVAWGDTSSVGPLPFTRVSSGITKVAASSALGLALTEKGEVVAWSDGNLNNEQDVPQTIQGSVTDIAAGSFWGIALVSNGSVVGWGDDLNAALPVPEVLSSGGTVRAIAIAAGSQHGLALLANSSVVAWGSDKLGQRQVPPAASTNVSIITARGESSAAVLSDGTMVAWGNADTIPAGIQQVGISMVALGTDHAVAVLRNGSFVTWSHVIAPRFPAALQQVLSAPPEVYNSTIVAVSAGENVSTVLLSTGRVVAWGTSSVAAVPVNARSDVIAIAAGGGYALAVIGSSNNNATEGAGSTLTTSPTTTVLGPSHTDTRATKLGAGVLVGIIIGSVALVSLAVTGALLYRKGLWRSSQGHSNKHTLKTLGPSAQALSGTAVWEELTKTLRPQETFMASVAHEYSWDIGSSVKGVMHYVEAGVNDTQLDRLQQSGQLSQPVVELSKAELQDQVHLLADGLLGRGGTALVFKCVWPSRFGPNSLLAIKVLKDGSDADVGAMQSFAYEAQLLAALKHHNVVRVYGYCLEPPTMCLILELLPTSLKQRLYGVPAAQLQPQSTALQTTDTPHHTASCSSDTQQTAVASTNPASERAASLAIVHATSLSIETAIVCTVTQSSSSKPPPSAMDSFVSLAPVHTAAPPMTLLEIVRTSTDIAAGLAYLHSQEEPVIPESEEAALAMQISSPKDKRIVHRDLKPANILLNSEGAAKITDFGLARDHDQTTVAAVNMGAGTMPYMAPEQLTAARAGRAALDATNRVDIYSLGMMMWEMLAQEAPWKGKSEDMIFAVVMNHRRPPLPGEPSQDGQPLPHVPGLYDHPLLPQFTSIIKACWQQRDRKRPTAAEVYDMLQTLLKNLELRHAMQP